MITEVLAVRARPHGRVSVRFTQRGWEIRRCPVSWEDLTVWYWWSFGISLVVAWLGMIPVYAFGQPKVTGLPFALPGALLLAGFLLSCLVSAIAEVIGWAVPSFGRFTSSGRHRLFGVRRRGPEPVLLVLPAHAAVGARVTRHWRRVVVTVRMVDGAEFRYSRFGLRGRRRELESGFTALLGPRLHVQHA